MSFLKKLFSRSATADTLPQGEEFKGFMIFATPIRDGKCYRIGARIEKEVDGTVQVHQLIRADVLQDEQDACAASVAKAKQMINEQGVGLFR